MKDLIIEKDLTVETNECGLIDLVGYYCEENRYCTKSQSGWFCSSSVHNETQKTWYHKWKFTQKKEYCEEEPYKKGEMFSAFYIILFVFAGIFVLVIC